MGKGFIANSLGSWRLWFWSLIIIYVMSLLVAHVFPPSKGMVTAAFGSSTVAIDGFNEFGYDFKYDEDKGIIENYVEKYIGVHFFSFGIWIEPEDPEFTLLVQSTRVLPTYVMCVGFLFLTFIFVILISQDSTAGTNILPSYWLLTFGSIAYSLDKIDKSFQNAGDLNSAFIDWKVTILMFLGISLAVGIAARLITKFMMNIGVVSGVDSISGEPLIIDVDELGKVMQPVQTHSSAGTKRVGRNAIFCPFCGANQFKRTRDNSICLTCERQIGMLAEKANQPRCAACDTGTVLHAKFCYNCGAFLENQSLPV